MAETHQEVVKVWIAPGCIVCDSCENDCPEVFDVQEETCVIRPPAQNADFLKSLTPSIIVAAEGCPVDVIKFETKEVPGQAPWANAAASRLLAGRAAHWSQKPRRRRADGAAGSEVAGAALQSARSARRFPPDSPRPSGEAPKPIRPRRSSSSINKESAGIDWKHVPPDQRGAMLAARRGRMQPATPWRIASGRSGRRSAAKTAGGSSTSRWSSPGARWPPSPPHSARCSRISSGPRC